MSLNAHHQFGVCRSYSFQEKNMKQERVQQASCFVSVHLRQFSFQEFWAFTLANDPVAESPGRHWRFQKEILGDTPKCMAGIRYSNMLGSCCVSFFCCKRIMLQMPVSILFLLKHTSICADEPRTACCEKTQFAETLLLCSLHV